MANHYELPGGLNWVKKNIHTIIGNEPLEKIMAFGDTWRARGHVPLVHVISPAMDDGKMWDQHADPSGLLDNIAQHIDMFVVDFHNRYEPEMPHIWQATKSPPTWLLWEYKAGYVKFNGTQGEFVRKFGLDPTDLSSITGGSTSTGGDSGGSTTTTTSGDVNIHLVCPHCGEKIF